MKRLAILLALLSLGWPAPARADLRAAAAKVDITPRNSQWLLGYQARQSDGVLDHIYHRVLALDAGGTPFYLISTDVCLFSPSFHDAVMRELQTRTGVDPAHVWWSVTHTHAAPELGPPDMYKVLLGRSDHEWDREYTKLVVDALIEAVKTAHDTLEPARLSVATTAANANINRRARDVDGKTSLGLNPDGPVDRQVNLIRVQRPDGSPIALVVNYAMHGTVMSGQNLKISGDAPGVVAAYVEEQLGGTVLYINGAAGNIAPIYSVYADPSSGHLSQFRVLLGDRVISAVRAMPSGTDRVVIRHARQVVETPRRADLSWPDEMATYATNDRQRLRLPLRFVAINDNVIWSAPVEMFCEIAMGIRERSPFKQTFYFGYTNGWFGYLPTARGFDEGGYEPRTSPFTSQVESDLTTAVNGFLRIFRK
jgi:Neutral/alkaline non-lysosomal ceramidase, N-terminal